MNRANKTIDIVLITDDFARASMLRRFLKNNGIAGRLRVINQRTKALANMQQTDPPSTAPCPDLIMFDFSEPQPRALALLQDAVFGQTAPAAPVILLTSRSSEQLLENGAVRCGDATMFAPKTLASFVKKLREHQRDRFLRAAAVLSDLGPILVRLPDSFARQIDGLTMLTA